MSDLNKIAALRAQGALRESSSELVKSYERLSSGMRINHAADDPAGLALASSLSLDSRIFTQAVRNINDGISFLSIAEAATSELSNILTRIKELVTESSNGSFNSTQISALDTEADALRDEYNRIVQSTSYNGASLFTSTPATISIQAGAGSLNAIDISVGASLAQSATATYSTTVGNGTLSLNQTLTTGTTPHEAAIVDLNGDGYNDIISTGYGEDKVSIFINNGNGTFKARVSYAAGSQPRGIETYDLNGDSNQDLIVGDDLGHTISVLLGNGNGTFATAISYAVDSNAVRLEIADINNDGKVDAISTGFNAGVVSVSLGNGNGSFQSTVSYAGTTSLRDIAVADYNGDGYNDIVANGNGDDTVSLYLNNGNGTFKARTTLAATTGTLSVISGDFNGDSKQDIASAIYVSGQVAIWLGNGNGTFSSRVNYTTPALPWEASQADFNGDGYSDLITAQGNASGGIAVLLNNGNGTFKAAVSYTFGSAGRSIAVGDLNADGVSDAIVSNSATNNMGVYFTATTTSTASTSYSGLLLPSIDLTTTSGRSLASSIVDGVANLVTIEKGNISARQSRLSVALDMASALSVDYAQAADRITDVDTAFEVARLLRNQILTQAATAILAQANQSAGLFNDLLNGLSRY